MKTLKTITLSMVFLFGLTVMGIEPNEETPNEATITETTTAEEIVVQKEECYLLYTACDKQYPGDYGDFRYCMESNGC